MRPLFVVKVDPAVDDAIGLEAIGNLVQVDGFLLEGSPEPFDEDVVEITTAPIYYPQVFACKHLEALRF